MTSVSECRLIVDPPAPGAWNMAVDEVLLTSAADEGVATLRLYRWDEPTLSLGYFQRHADREQHAASRESAIVRRQTGGGAILHDRELTYSLALPAAHPLARDKRRLYTVVHQAVIELLAPLVGRAGGPWGLRFEASGSCDAPVAEPFLCFERRACGDVVLAPAAPAVERPASETRCWKVLGSAQRRRRGAILQHGSLLLGRSPAAPELPGLCEVARVDVGFGPLANQLPPLLAGRLQLGLQRAELSSAMGRMAAKMAGERYGDAAWTRRR